MRCCYTIRSILRSGIVEGVTSIIEFGQEELAGYVLLKKSMAIFYSLRSFSFLWLHITFSNLQICSEPRASPIGTQVSTPAL